MKQRIISGILAVVMLCCTMPTFVLAEEDEKKEFVSTYALGHQPGESYRTVTQEDCIAMEKASKIAKGIRLNEGGSATFGFHVPYFTRAVKIAYENANGEIVVKIGDNEYKFTPEEPDGEYNLVFGENLGIDPQHYAYGGDSSNGFWREFCEHRGEKVVTVSGNSGLVIKEMVFEKELTPIDAAGKATSASEETRDTFSTVLIHENAAIIVANGGRRWVDNYDTGMKPYVENGRMYLPINTLANALGYYNEDQPHRDYALMRNDTHEVLYLNGVCTVAQGMADHKPTPYDVIIHRDGKTLASVRYFGELIGDTVAYQNGLVVIDNKYTVEDILEDGPLNDFATAKFKDFMDEKIVGKTYFVAQNHSAASDDNNGSAVAPFKTLTKAAAVAEAGDTVIVREGVYRETLKPLNDGMSSAPITFKAAEGEKVVISANEVLDTWAHHKDNIYVSGMDWDLGVTRNQLFIDDKMLNEARHPNGPELLIQEDMLDNAWPVKGNLLRPMGEANSSIVRSPSLLWQKEPDYWKGGYFIGFWSSNFAVMTANIIGSKEGELLLGDEKSYQWYYNETLGEGYSQYGYIVGHMNALDAPGEWILEDDTMHLIFPEGRTPENTVVEAKKRQLVIDLNDRKFVTVDGFETIGGGIRMGNAEMCMLNDNEMHYISHYIHQSDSYKGRVEFPLDTLDPNGAPERGESGIFVTGTDNIITNNEIDHSAGAGIISAGIYAYIENNVIHDSYNANYVSGIQIMTRASDAIDKPRGGAAIYYNTIYNTGRSAINISVDNNNGQTHAQFLPMDIAYNDFHDGALATADTAIVYGYHTQQGLDGYNSSARSNYMYMTKENPRDKHMHQNGFYHDGCQMGLDTYDNHIFYTGATGISGNSVYFQLSKLHPAYAREWSNNVHGKVHGGVEGLHEGYFIEGKPYHAGSWQGVDYTMNYDRFVKGEYGMSYKAKDAELSEGVTLDEESGYAQFSGNDQYVHFKDVEFPEKADMLVFAVRGDSSYSQDVVDIIVGDSIETGKLYSVTTKLNAYDVDTPERVKCVIKETTGTHDVWVKTRDYRSIEIGGMGAYKIASQTIPEEYAALEYAGQFKEKVKFDSRNNTEGPTPLVMMTINADAPILNNTWPGWYVKYRMDLNSDSDTFIMNAGSGGANAHQPFEIYIDGLEEENFVARFNEDSDAWADKAPQLVPMNKTIEAGTHDVYVKMPGDDGFGKSSTIVFVAFAKKGADLSSLKAATENTYGGDFSPEISIQNEDFPFKAAKINPPNYDYPGLLYTLPGTVAGYKDVKVNQDSTKFILSYSTEEGLHGQPVEIWVGDPKNGGKKIAEFITKGDSGRFDFFEETFELDEVIPQGTCDVYLVFGGDLESRQNCNIDWFKFAE